MFSPWPHQTFGVSQVIAAVRAGVRRVLLTSPTGMGKSYMIGEIIKWGLSEGMRPVLYTNRKLLIEQLHGFLSGEGISHGVRASGRWDNVYADVQVSSIPTEVARLKRKRGHSLHRSELAICDEAHLNKETGAKNIQKWHLDAGASWLGVTATPIGLNEMYDKLIVAGCMTSGRQCGALVMADHFGPDEPDMRKFKPNTKTGEYTENQIKKAIMTKTVWGRVLSHWQRLNPLALPTILFAPGVPESIWFCEQFRKAGYRAAHIDGDNVIVDGVTYDASPAKRKEVVDGVKSGYIQVICNRFVLREGIDIPELRHGIFATVFGSLQSYLQSGGRLLRRTVGKDTVTVQDHGGNWWRWGSLNMDREWDLRCTPTMLASLRAMSVGAGKEPEPVCCPRCFACRSAGATCPRCGFTISRRSRMVV
jgi:superfamily II DNA or RNA helicase